MVIKPLAKSLELILLEYLNAHMKFTDEEEKQFYYLKKGFEGEQKSAEWLMKGLTDHWLVLHALLLEYYGSKFQIDTLVIAYEKLYLLDVKYFEGDYSIKDGKWYNPSNIPQKNPLHQLERCETLLQKLLHDLEFTYPIESYLVFNNPEFHLNTTIINPTIIYPAQLNRFLKKLNTKPRKLTNRYFQLAEQLVSRHIIESPYDRLPNYSFESLKKGIVCLKCNCICCECEGEFIVCKKCGSKEDTEAAVLLSVEKYVLLFPGRKITTNSIFEWCGGIKSKKAIRRILNKHFKLVGHSQTAHYVEKNDK